MTLVWSDSGPDVNDEVTATLNFKNNDVRAIYIDWADGTNSSNVFSNKREYANYQWIQTTEPIDSIEVKHTYNASGVFNPVVQTVNSRGFVSRYYSAEATNTDITPYSQDTGIAACTVSDSTATGILRVENTTVDSGIDNSLFEKEGPKSIYIQIPPNLTNTQLDYAGTMNLELELLVANSSTNVQITDGKMNSGYDTTLEKLTVAIASASGKTGLLDSGLGSGKSVAQVLGVKYVNPKITGTYATDYTRNAALNSLKIFVVAIADDGTIYPIAYVSPGRPYKSVDEVKRFLTMDMGQSRAAASNIDNKYYFYDNGKGYFSPDVGRWGDVNGALSSGKFTNSTRQTSSTKTVNYTYYPRPTGIGGYTATGASAQYIRPFGTGATDLKAAWYYSGTTATAERTNQFATDDFGRFYDRYHLVRNSMEPSSSAANVSSISGNQVSLTRITPVINFSSRPISTKFDITGTTGCWTEDYTTAAFNNAAGNATGRVSLSGMNNASFTDATIAGALDRSANEYLLALWDSKTNKIFMQATPWWSGSTYKAAGTDLTDSVEGLKIAGVSYLRATDPETISQNLEWIPLNFEDTTVSSTEYRSTGSTNYQTFSNSFTKSGYISFDMPLDWSAVKMEDLYGGTMWTGATASDSYNPVASPNVATDVSGSYAIGKFAATCSASPLTSPYTVWGKGLTLTGAAVSGALDEIGSRAEDIGAFKYIAELQAAVPENGLDGQNLWVAKITGNGVTDYTNGWDADDELYLHFGEATGSNYTEPGAGEVYDVIIKRINFYDVLPGNSKVYPTPVTKSFNPVDNVSAQFPNKYGFNDYTDGAALGLKTAWSGTSKYPLLITISGATSGVGATDYYSPEIWNVLDATQGFTTLVKENDDSAYNLNPLSVTSDIALAQGGNYYRAITRKGKVFIAKTGISLASVGFSSVALGDRQSATAFADKGPGTQYGMLHLIRRLQTDAVNVYWDEPQKDGTFVRLWGIITNLNETHGLGGSRASVKYTFNMSVEEIALIDKNGNLMTKPFPLGGIEDEKSYS